MITHQTKNLFSLFRYAFGGKGLIGILIFFRHCVTIFPRTQLILFTGLKNKIASELSLANFWLRSKAHRLDDIKNFRLNLWYG